MNRLGRLVFLLALCGSLQANTPDQEPQKRATLRDAITTAIENNFLLKESAERVIQFDYRIKEAKAGYLPKASLSLDAEKRDERNLEIIKDEFNSRSGGLRITQNLYDGSATSSSVDRYTNLQYESKEQHRATLETEILKIIDAYLGVVYQREALKTVTQNMQLLEKILEIVTIKVQSGAANIGEQSSIQASVADANKTKVTVESRYADAISLYEFLTGDAIEELDPFEKTVPMQIPMHDEMLNDITAGNAELRALHYRLQGKKHELTWQKSDFLPKVELIGSIDDSDTKQGGDGFKKNKSIKAQLTQKLFDGFESESKTKRIYSELNEINYKIEHASKRLYWDGKKLHNSIQTLRDTLDNSQTELDATQSMVDSYWERFRHSSQDLFILLSAQKQLFEIKFARLQYHKNQTVDYFKLLALEGKLLETLDMTTLHP